MTIFYVQVMHTTPLSMQGRSGLDAVAMAYAREVYIRNESQLQGLSHNLITTFHNASLKFVDKVCMYVRTCVHVIMISLDQQLYTYIRM